MEDKGIVFMFLGGLPDFDDPHNGFLWKEWLDGRKETSFFSLVSSPWEEDDKKQTSSCCFIEHPMSLEDPGGQAVFSRWKDYLKQESSGMHVFRVDSHEHLKTKWATRSLSDATIMMMVSAVRQLNDAQNKSYQKFVLLDKTTVPLYSFQTICQIIRSNDKSWLDAPLLNNCGQMFQRNAKHYPSFTCKSKKACKKEFIPNKSEDCVITSQWCILDRQDIQPFLDATDILYIKPDEQCGKQAISSLGVKGDISVLTENQMKVATFLESFKGHSGSACVISDEIFFATFMKQGKTMNEFLNRLFLVPINQFHFHEFTTETKQETSAKKEKMSWLSKPEQSTFIAIVPHRQRYPNDHIRHLAQMFLKHLLLALSKEQSPTWLNVDLSGALQDVNVMVGVNKLKTWVKNIVQQGGPVEKNYEEEDVNLQSILDKNETSGAYSWANIWSYITGQPGPENTLEAEQESKKDAIWSSLTKEMSKEFYNQLQHLVHDTEFITQKEKRVLSRLFVLFHTYGKDGNHNVKEDFKKLIANIDKDIKEQMIMLTNIYLRKQVPYELRPMRISDQIGSISQIPVPSTFTDWNYVNMLPEITLASFSYKPEETNGIKSYAELQIETPNTETFIHQLLQRLSSPNQKEGFTFTNLIHDSRGFSQYTFTLSHKPYWSHPNTYKMVPLSSFVNTYNLLQILFTFTGTDSTAARATILNNRNLLLQTVLSSYIEKAPTFEISGSLQQANGLEEHLRHEWNTMLESTALLRQMHHPATEDDYLSLSIGLEADPSFSQERKKPGSGLPHEMTNEKIYKILAYYTIFMDVYFHETNKKKTFRDRHGRSVQLPELIQKELKYSSRKKGVETGSDTISLYILKEHDLAENVFVGIPLTKRIIARARDRGALFIRKCGPHSQVDQLADVLIRQNLSYPYEM